jgi:hypothetical protein
MKEREVHAVELSGSETAAIWSAITEAAETWGAEWEPDASGGALELPVAAGLRLGLLRGRLSTSPGPSGTRLLFEVNDSEYRVHTAAVVVLALGAAGGAGMVILPFVPSLLPLLPAAFILPLLAWFLVLSRLKNRGPREFLELVVQRQAAN